MSSPEPNRPPEDSAPLIAERLEWQPADIAAYRRADGLHLTFTLWTDSDSGKWDLLDGRTRIVRRYPTKAAALAAAAAMESARDRPPPVIAESALAALAN